MGAPLKVLTLIASATEIVCGLGAHSQLIGISHECDYPESIRHLPVCTSARVSMKPPSLDIHTQVHTLIEQALSLYEVSSDMLQLLKPDLIITQDHCRVCAVSLSDVEHALQQLQQQSVEVVSLFPASLEDIWKDIRTIAAALSRESLGEELIDSMLKELHAVAEPSDNHPRVACLEWTEPLMACGNWIPDLVRFAGGIECLGKPGVHSGIIEKSELLKADPDIIVVAPCGFDLKRSIKESKKLFDDSELQNLTAYKNREIYVADGNAYFNRPGPRIVDSAKILHEIFNQGRDNSYRLTAWSPLLQDLE